jgi:adenosylcobinamide-phosphate synthase
MVDTVVGDPRSAVHPVALIGRLIAWLESLLLAGTDSVMAKRIKGALLVAIVLTVVYGLVWGVVRLLETFVPGAGVLLAEALVLSFTISPRSLSQAGLQIRRQILAGNFSEARRQVGQIVGRDTDNLDEREITRATVETMAENIVDGIISPLFFAWLGGVPLAFLYRAVNTMDSMLGYRNERYADFGMIAARTDDVFNYVPARITGALVVVSAWLLRLDARGAVQAIWRDAAKHPSPNSGISEAGVAGALGIQLGGLNYYGGVASQRATMGTPLQELRAFHIRQTVSIIYGVTALFVGLLMGLSFWGFQYGWLV